MDATSRKIFSFLFFWFNSYVQVLFYYTRNHCEWLICSGLLLVFSMKIIFTMVFLRGNGKNISHLHILNINFLNTGYVITTSISIVNARICVNITWTPRTTWAGWSKPARCYRMLVSVPPIIGTVNYERNQKNYESRQSEQEKIKQSIRFIFSVVPPEQTFDATNGYCGMFK